MTPCWYPFLTRPGCGSIAHGTTLLGPRQYGSTTTLHHPPTSPLNPNKRSTCVLAEQEKNL
ncbi:hypothetical protein E2C01_052431 [Portunus trituberculatus]|uniref:Uncharacterized protein n=1 Tax=Portunus trituberculatus TaxID=210409 RepID=A0A5B7GLJ0_PORTR|nr:hypothetical protein [Portunus trituberculatus]